MTINKQGIPLLIIFIICLGIIFVYWFLQLSREEQIKKVKEWLLWACTEAEKALGEKTGKLKLRMVYGMFVDKFTWVAKMITFEEFSNLVDSALEEMKLLIESNEAVKGFISGN